VSRKMFGGVCGRAGLAIVLAGSTLTACVQTRQFADVQFTPPSGNYKLLVLRPDVTVGSLTSGGMVEPRADWTEQARARIIEALRAQQAARGGNLTIVEHRAAGSTWCCSMQRSRIITKPRSRISRRR
jgi:hypothetical protein